MVREVKSQQIVIDGTRFANPKEQWKGAGTAIPCSESGLKDDFGVGDFLDIKKMVDWCVKTGQKVLQILPINDTTMTGNLGGLLSYKANSIFALHPMYLRPEAVGRLENDEKREYFDGIRKELNDLAEIDYERVNNTKHEYLRLVFAQDFQILPRPANIKFIAANEYWLLPWAVWSVLRDEYHTPTTTTGPCSPPTMRTK